MAPGPRNLGAPKCQSVTSFGSWVRKIGSTQFACARIVLTEQPSADVGVRVTLIGVSAATVPCTSSPAARFACRWVCDDDRRGDERAACCQNGRDAQDVHDAATKAGSCVSRVHHPPPSDCALRFPREPHALRDERWQPRRIETRPDIDEFCPRIDEVCAETDGAWGGVARVSASPRDPRDVSGGGLRGGGGGAGSRGPTSCRR